MADAHSLLTQAPILVVDDNPANVALLCAVLEEDGYENLHSTSDPFAVERLCQKTTFDLLLLDIRMPGLDGFAVMERLSAQIHDGLPILVLTAQIDRATRIRALAGGARDFITKPFDTEEVLHRVRNLLELRLLYRERNQEAAALEHKVQARTQQLREAHHEAIRILARAGEYRDTDTGRHVERMSRYCQCLARAAGLDDNSCDIILHAAQMHDLGKIGIPDHILHKPDKLTNEERATISTHSEIGATILSADSTNPIIRMAHTIALTHHEKWDGSGYPRGLVGEDIPIEGRITAICDVFDALTMKRPYKEPWPADNAIDMLRQQAGRHFDPRLVALFLDILPAILAIKIELDGN